MASYSWTVVHGYQFNQSVGKRRKLSFFNQVVEVVVIRYGAPSTTTGRSPAFFTWNWIFSDHRVWRAAEWKGRRNSNGEAPDSLDAAHLEKNQASRVLLLLLHLYCLFIAPGADQRRKTKRTSPSLAPLDNYDNFWPLENEPPRPFGRRKKKSLIEWRTQESVRLLDSADVRNDEDRLTNDLVNPIDWIGKAIDDSGGGGDVAFSSSRDCAQCIRWMLTIAVCFCNSGLFVCGYAFYSGPLRHTQIYIRTDAAVTTTKRAKFGPAWNFHWATLSRFGWRLFPYLFFICKPIWRRRLLSPISFFFSLFILLI